jgi:kynurenine/2-aminoadipate aminotransferase
MISIETDSHGMNAEHLNQVLSNWSDSNSLPKAIYTIPNGSNPTGASMDLKRKKDIYSVKKIIDGLED